MWAKKPLRTIEDFKGIKMRMMPLMGDVLAKHDMSVIFVPGGEIMPNLQRGVLDSHRYGYRHRGQQHRCLVLVMTLHRFILPFHLLFHY